MTGHVEVPEAAAVRPTVRRRVARVLTEVLAPSVVGVVCPVVVGAASDADAWRGAGLGLLGAPSLLLWLLFGEVLLVVACLAISRGWKVSMHAAVAAGTAAAFVVILGSWALLAAVPVALVCWARVVLGDHTRGQVVVGAVLGAAVLALLTFARLAGAGAVEGLA